jgi:hypothetical protein
MVFADNNVWRIGANLCCVEGDMWIKSCDGNLYNLEHMRDVRKAMDTDDGTYKVMGDQVAYGSNASYTSGPKVCLKHCATADEAQSFVEVLAAALGEDCVHAERW